MEKQIRFAEDTIKELTPERIQAIKTYTELQPKFKDLAITGVTGYFFIKYLNNELDIDSLSETQMKKLDNAKDEKTREHLSKDLPRTDVAYNLYYISPFRIEETINKFILPVDHLETSTIEEINKRIQERLDLYSSMIKKEDKTVLQKLKEVLKDILNS